MRRVLALTAFIALSAALSVSFMLIPSDISSAAAETGEFVIPVSDGYGATACLADGDECGVVVAQSWCGSHGFSRVLGYGARADGSVAIACGR